MYNPFKEVIEEEHQDHDLIQKSLAGDKNALESLVLRHQSWIYNIALRMLCDQIDAEDATQEVLVKVITKLALYNPALCAFRTWLYRITANHIINWKNNKKETVISELIKSGNFEEYASSIPDKRSWSKPESQIINEEVKMSCVHCMLLCLKRRERMVFILGVIFGIHDSVGAEILDISKANFRKVLSRSREKIFRFFTRQCSILNENNPCRCTDRLRSMIKLDLVDPDNLVITHESHATVQEIISDSFSRLEDAYYEFNALFRSQPFLKSPDITLWLRELIGRDEIRALFNLV